MMQHTPVHGDVRVPARGHGRTSTNHTASAAATLSAGHSDRPVHYLENVSGGVITLTPQTAQSRAAYLLRGEGRANYRQVEVTGRLRWAKGQQMLLSYVRSRSRGNLNEFSRYLGDFASPVIPPDLFTQRPEDIPNRFLGWGSFSLPWKLSVYPVVEYRTGFTYAAVDAARNYVGVPYSGPLPVPELLLGGRAHCEGYSLPGKIHPAIFRKRIQSYKSLQPHRRPCQCE